MGNTTRVGKTITVFGSSKPRPDDPEYRIAFELGSALAKAGFTVCSGGYGGTMEAVSRGAAESGGKTVGVTFEHFGLSANRWIHREIKVPSLPDRLLQLVEQGDGYVVLRGGTGTLLELALVWELAHKELMSGKPIVLLGGFWEPVITLIENAEMGGGAEQNSALLTRLVTPQSCADFLKKKLFP